MKEEQPSYNFTKGGSAMKEMEVVINTGEIADYFFTELIRRGYVPDEDEVQELADIMFDFLIDKRIIDEDIEEGEWKWRGVLVIFCVGFDMIWFFL